jgi:hypothetical protein
MQHLRKVKPNATMAEKMKIIDRADEVWGNHLADDGVLPLKYRGEQINVEYVRPSK